MRKHVSLPALWVYVCVLICVDGLAVGRDLAQARPVTVDAQTAGTAPVMPKDAKAVMLLAAKQNGLAGGEMKPWHFKASYTLMDEKGNALVEKGTIEEWWVNAKKSRITYASGDRSQSTYVTEQGWLRSGNLDLVSGLAQEASNEWLSPLPSVEFVEKESFEKKEHDFAGTKLNCLTFKMGDGSQPIAEFARPTYCFAPDKPVLRIAIFLAGNRQVVTNNIAMFHGQYVFKDIKITDHGKASLAMHLENLESMTTVDEAILAPPADAKVLRKTVGVSVGVAQGMILKQVKPEYPLHAKSLGVQGTVVVGLTIGKDGKVHDLDVINGPKELQEAAKDAVKQWTYRPYLLNGEPVEVNSQVFVVFALGR